MSMPGRETEVVLKTMRKTPNEIREMTEISRREYFSRWKRKAKRRTKMRVDDLHIAAWRSASSEVGRGETHCRD